MRIERLRALTFCIFISTATLICCSYSRADEIYILDGSDIFGSKYRHGILTLSFEGPAVVGSLKLIDVENPIKVSGSISRKGQMSLTVFSTKVKKYVFLQTNKEPFIEWSVNGNS